MFHSIDFHSEASFDEKSNPSHSERHSRSSDFDSPMTTKQLLSFNAEGKMTAPMATLDANNYGKIDLNRNDKDFLNLFYKQICNLGN